MWVELAQEAPFFFYTNKVAGQSLILKYSLNSNYDMVMVITKSNYILIALQWLYNIMKTEQIAELIILDYEEIYNIHFRCELAY